MSAAVAENKIVREIESVSVTRANTMAADILGAFIMSWNVYPPCTDMILLMAAAIVPSVTNLSIARMKDAYLRRILALTLSFTNEILA